jgi:predicted enzyme related to lactoylglutathione lyase
MPKPPAWFDITARDAEASRAFYTGLFGWDIKIDESMNYGLVSPAAGRIPGGIGQAGEGYPHPAGIVTYFTVDDLDESLRAARKLGSFEAVPAWEIPGFGRMAVVLDPDGNRVGLWQQD